MRLILGPWTHGDRSLSYAGDIDFGAAAAVDGNLAEDFFALRRRWFDRWLKDVPNGVESEPPVRAFVMGGGSGRRNSAGRLDHGGPWRSATDWPLPETQWRKFYLHSDRSLGCESPAQGAQPLVYIFDPRCPVPTIGGALSSGEPVMRGGAYDQREGPHVFGATEPFRPLAKRPDVLVFATPPLDRNATGPVTPPLDRDLEVTGPVALQLWIASDAPDTDFTANLIDVHPANDDYPEGFAMNLTDGILRVRYRDSWEEPSPMMPGEVYAITSSSFRRAICSHQAIGCGSTSRAAISHTSTSTRIRESQKARWSARASPADRVFVDAARPSHIILPVIP
jgi:putative CocE/NonD family hydrolase